ncbi:MAG: hypothetical protein [Bacteriophage sp.]|nr:MAG: hypothetical protein [Bacteriophage sp.]
MLNRDFILSKLSPYTNNKSVLIQNQTVGDIKKGLLQWHKKYQSEYDKIAPYFKGDSIEESAQNVFDFLKLYVDYNIESENEQTLRSPAAILAPGKTVGADCKNYSLFTAGILDSISRNTDQHIPLALRFASYDLFSSIPKHVFTVINPGTRHEIWVDPVLSYLNEKKEPSHYSDKKINDMSLIAMSGVETMTSKQMYNGLIAERSQMISSGRIKAGDQTDQAYINCINSLADQIGVKRLSLMGDAASSILNSGITKTAASAIPYGTIITTVLSAIFAKNGPNPNDWQGWTPGDVKYWTTHDGDSVNNEAVNILKYINSHGLKDITDADTFGVNRVTLSQISDKVKRGGFPNEAQQLLNVSSTTLDPFSTQAAPGTKAGMNIWITAGIAAGAIYFISKMKK